MRVLPSVSVTADMLTGVTADEAAPGLYNAGTTYGALARCHRTGTQNSLLVYESLSAGNTGHTPESSPLWWKLISIIYGAYDGGHSYDADDRVYDLTNHLEYKSLVGSNSGQPLTDTSKWQLQGATNRWRAYDLYRNTGTTTSSPQVHRITPGQRVNSVALVGLVAESVLIEIVVAGNVEKSISDNLSDRATAAWSDYFQGSFVFKTAVAHFDIPAYSSAEIRITVTRTTGDVTVGGILFGMSVYLGRTLHEAESDALNTSEVTRDLDGKAEMIPRPDIPRTVQQVRFKREHTRKLLQTRAALSGRPALWSGLDDAEHGYFEALLILGFFRRMSLNLDKAEEGLINLELEEV